MTIQNIKLKKMDSTTKIINPTPYHHCIIPHQPCFVFTSFRVLLRATCEHQTEMRKKTEIHKTIKKPCGKVIYPFL